MHEGTPSSAEQTSGGRGVLYRDGVISRKKRQTEETPSGDGREEPTGHSESWGEKKEKREGSWENQGRGIATTEEKRAS